MLALVLVVVAALLFAICDSLRPPLLLLVGLCFLFDASPPTTSAARSGARSARRANLPQTPNPRTDPPRADPPPADLPPSLPPHSAFMPAAQQARLDARIFYRPPQTSRENLLRSMYEELDAGSRKRDPFLRSSGESACRQRRGERPPASRI